MAYKDYTSAIDILKVDGHNEIVGTPTVTILKVDSNNNVLLAKGATLPTDADAGYAKGCRFILTGGSTGNTEYVNEGSATSADFNKVITVGARIPITPADLTSLFNFATVAGVLSASTGTGAVTHKIAVSIGNGAGTAYLHLWDT